MLLYKVDCWVKAKTEAELSHQEELTELFKKAIFSGNPREIQLIEQIEKDHKGMVLHTLIIESDDPIQNPEEEIMPEIRKVYPEAQYIICELLKENNNEDNIPTN